MGFQAQRGGEAVLADPRRDLNLYQAVLPSGGGAGRFWSNPMGVIAERFVKRGAISQSSVDLVCLLRGATREDVGLDRNQ
jgi:hypothetical protein